MADVSGTPDETSVPRVTTLAQNYPNPFNPQTWIEYSLPSQGPVQLRIFDERGRLVRTLTDGVVQSGEHRERWDGKDQAGKSVASGVYHYTLETEAGVLSHKMTLLR